MKKLVLGIVLCVAAFAAPLLLVAPVLVSLARDDAVALEAPGELDVTIEEPGRYYVWNEYNTVYLGKTYSVSKELPSGIMFSLVESDTGEAVPFEGDLSISVSAGERARNSAGYFDIEDSGEYRLEIAGLDQPRVFAFGPSVWSDMFSFFGRILLGVLLAVIFLTAGVLLVVFGVISIAQRANGRLDPRADA